MKKFKINDVVWDSASKDFVQISNGIEKDGEFTPTEARAYRVLGFDKGRAVVGYTFRGVKPEDLSHLVGPSSGPFNRDSGDYPQRVGKYFVGRV